MRDVAGEGMAQRSQSLEQGETIRRGLHRLLHLPPEPRSGAVLVPDVRRGQRHVEGLGRARRHRHWLEHRGGYVRDQSSTGPRGVPSGNEGPGGQVPQDRRGGTFGSGSYVTRTRTRTRARARAGAGAAHSFSSFPVDGRASSPRGVPVASSPPSHPRNDGSGGGAVHSGGGVNGVFHHRGEVGVEPEARNRQRRTFSSSSVREGVGRRTDVENCGERRDGVQGARA